MTSVFTAAWLRNGDTFSHAGETFTVKAYMGMGVRTVVVTTDNRIFSFAHDQKLTIERR